MLKPSIKNIIVFFFLKYLIFYIFMMFKNNDYTLIEVSSIRNGEDLLFYLWVFLFLPFMCSLIFTGPLYGMFKGKSGILFLFYLLVILLLEYLFYTFMASRGDFSNGVYNGIIGLLVLLLLFFKPISLIFRQKS